MGSLPTVISKCAIFLILPGQVCIQRDLSSLHNVSVDTVVERILQIGPETLLTKVDIKQYLCQGLHLFLYKSYQIIFEVSQLQATITSTELLACGMCYQKSI